MRKRIVKGLPIFVLFFRYFPRRQPADPFGSQRPKLHKTGAEQGGGFLNLKGPIPFPAEELPQAYGRANSLAAKLKGKVFKDKVIPHWFHNNTRFWYRNDLRGGDKEFILVDAEQGTRTPAFDHQRLADSLSKAAGVTYPADRLPFNGLEFVGDKTLQFQVGEDVWKCDLTSYECTRSGNMDQKQEEPPPVEDNFPELEETGFGESSPQEAEEEEDAAPQQKQKQFKKRLPLSPNRDVRSPDSKWTALVKDFNAYLRDQDGTEIPLTSDGVAGNSYGSFTWSPDSKTLVAYRTEPGDDKVVHTIETSPRDQLRAKLHTHVYPLPGDKFAAHEMWLFDIEAKEAVKVDIERIDFRGIPRLLWKEDSRHFTFHRTDRGHQRFRVIEVDVATGNTRNIIEEQAETFIDHYSGFFLHNLEDTNEIIYLSEMDGWKHLYLIDAGEGIIKNQITRGEWVVRGVERVDEENRQIWFRASGMNPGQDPYLVHYYRINFDGTGLVALTEGDGNHVIRYSPDRKYFIDSYSRLDLAPVTELRRASDGKLVCALEKADISALQETGWTFPEVFRSVGRDGETDIWGLVYRPQQFDREKKYPVIEFIYAGPHDSHVPKTFAPYRSMMALAELGFIVVQIDGMGTANRSRAFHDVCWKNIGDAGFPDRILWIKALARRYPYMDTTRVGIFGTSAGGQNALGALLFHGDFYKAAVASCGCHDNRLDKPTWNEQWMGLLGPHYAEQSNVTNAHKLQGKLMLIVGELDTNVPPESTMRVVDALIKAKKDFDLLVMPGLGHTSGGTYGEMRRQDFFVHHLHGMESPDRNMK